MKQAIVWHNVILSPGKAAETATIWTIFVNASPLQKLLDKGVDITAGVITGTMSAAIIALIATLTWRWKRKRDLRHEADKQRQQYAIAEELAANKRSKDTLDRVSELKRELEPLVEKFRNAGSAGNAHELQKAWDTWLDWLKRRQLEYLPGNRMIVDSWTNFSERFRDANSNRTVSQWAERLVQQVRQTQLLADDRSAAGLPDKGFTSNTPPGSEPIR